MIRKLPILIIIIFFVSTGTFSQESEDEIILETIGSDHDTSDVVSALTAVHEAERNDKHVTGLLYYNGEIPTTTETIGLTNTPLSLLSEEQGRPSKESLIQINERFRSS